MPAGHDTPRITERLMASTSMAWYSALRTRMSLNGFLPLTSEYSNSSRAWSIPRKMVRSSGPCTTVKAPELLMRATSFSGTLTVASSAPDSSDEVRVASDWIGVKLTSVRLWRGLSHHAGLATSTVLMSTSRDLSTNGPVPLVLRLAKFSFFCCRSLASFALLASHQDLLMTVRLSISLSSSGNGALVSTSTVKASTLRTSLTLPRLSLEIEPGVCMRCQLNTTSSAVMASPPWNLTLRRNLKRHTVGLTEVQDSASAGSISTFSLKRTSPS